MNALKNKLLKNRKERSVVTKKDFKGKIGDDFKAAVIEEKPSVGRKRTKAVPGARLILLSDIQPDKNQPRKNFNKAKLEELADSIKSRGIIEPITVRQDDEGFSIITGERRYKAAKKAGLNEIPCIIKEADDEDVLTYQLIENLQREDLNPVEEAYALKKLSDGKIKQADIAKLIGKSQPYISQSLKILGLPEEILKEALKKGTPKDQLLQRLRKPKPKGKPKTKPWMWKPEDKSFSVSIRFKKKDYDKEKVIKALEQLLEELKR